MDRPEPVVDLDLRTWLRSAGVRPVKAWPARVGRLDKWIHATYMNTHGGKEPPPGSARSNFVAAEDGLLYVAPRIGLIAVQWPWPCLNFRARQPVREQTTVTFSANPENPTTAHFSGVFSARLNAGAAEQLFEIAVPRGATIAV